MSFPWQSAFEIREQVATGEANAVDITRAYLDRAESLNGTLACFLSERVQVCIGHIHKKRDPAQELC